MNLFLNRWLLSFLPLPSCTWERKCLRNFVASAWGKQSFADKCVPKLLRRAVNSGTRVPLLHRALLLFTFSLFLFPFVLHADGTDSDLDAANNAYSSGKFEDAITLFQKIIDTRGYSAPLCFDLANAETKAGHPGRAILNYERARYLAPGDADIDHNLQLARTQAGLETNSYRWWQIVLRTMTINQWLFLVDGWLALIALAVLAHAFAPTLAPRLPFSERLFRQIIKTVLFVSIPAFLFFCYVAAMAAPLRIEGVVVAPKQATLRISPFDSAENIGTIPEGELVTVEDRHNDYLRIEARDHHYGWIQLKDLEPIIAGSFDAKPGN